MEGIDLDSAYFRMDDDGILRLTLRESDRNNIDMEMARLHIEASLKITKGIKGPVLVDTRNSYYSIDKDAQNFLAHAGPHVKLKTAEAILVNSLATKIIAYFYLKLHVPPNPAKVFTSEEKALTWIRKYADSDVTKVV